MNLKGVFGNLPSQRRLREELMKGYDKNINIKEDMTDPLNLEIGLSVIGLSLDEEKGIFEVCNEL